MIVFSEDSYVDPNTINGRELAQMAATARLFGCRVYSIPPNFDQCETAQASRRVGTPFISVDIGQLENGEWIVIEVGDGQFSGLSQAPILELWSELSGISY